MATRRKPGKPNVGGIDPRIHDGSLAELGRLVFLADQTDLLDPLASYLQNQGASSHGAHPGAKEPGEHEPDLVMVGPDTKEAWKTYLLLC